MSFHANTEENKCDLTTIFTVLLRMVHITHHSRHAEIKLIHYRKCVIRTLEPTSLPSLVEKDCTKPCYIKYSHLVTNWMPRISEFSLFTYWIRMCLLTVIPRWFICTIKSFKCWMNYELLRSKEQYFFKKIFCISISRYNV